MVELGEDVGGGDGQETGTLELRTSLTVQLERKRPTTTNKGKPILEDRSVLLTRCVNRHQTPKTLARTVMDDTGQPATCKSASLDSTATSPEASQHDQNQAPRTLLDSETDLSMEADITIEDSNPSNSTNISTESYQIPIPDPIPTHTIADPNRPPFKFTLQGSKRNIVEETENRKKSRKLNAPEYPSSNAEKARLALEQFLSLSRDSTATELKASIPRRMMDDALHAIIHIDPVLKWSTNNSNTAGISELVLNKLDSIVTGLARRSEETLADSIHAPSAPSKNTPAVHAPFANALKSSAPPPHQTKKPAPKITASAKNQTKPDPQKAIIPSRLAPGKRETILNNPDRRLIIAAKIKPETVDTTAPAVHSLNQALALHACEVAVLTIQISNSGNPVVIVRQGQTAEKLLKHSDVIAQILLNSPNTIPDYEACLDRPHFDAKINGVRAFHINGTPRDAESVWHELVTNDKNLEALTLAGRPKWIGRTTPGDAEFNQAHGTVVIGFESEADQKTFLGMQVGIVDCESVTFTAYIQRPLVRNCSDCGSVSHSQNKCRARCCLKCTSKEHSTGDHPETTPLKCINCGGAHESTARVCPERKIRLGLATGNDKAREKGPVRFTAISGSQGATTSLLVKVAKPTAPKPRKPKTTTTAINDSDEKKRAKVPLDDEGNPDWSKAVGRDAARMANQLNKQGNPLEKAYPVLALSVAAPAPADDQMDESEERTDPDTTLIDTSL